MVPDYIRDNPARRQMMLNLKLRDEVLGSQMPGTAIALRRKDNTGVQQAAKLALDLVSHWRAKPAKGPEPRQMTLFEQLEAEVE